MPFFRVKTLRSKEGTQEIVAYDASDAIRQAVLKQPQYWGGIYASRELYGGVDSFPTNAPNVYEFHAWSNHDIPDFTGVCIVERVNA